LYIQRRRERPGLRFLSLFSGSPFAFRLAGGEEEEEEAEEEVSSDEEEEEDSGEDDEDSDDNDDEEEESEDASEEEGIFAGVGGVHCASSSAEEVREHIL